MAGERTCPKCGTQNPIAASYCNLCQEPFLRRGVSSLAAEGLAARGSAPPASRSVPMLPFNEAAAKNVRMSRFLFLLLFAVFFALGGIVGKASGSLELGLALSLILYAILGASAWYSGSSIVLSLHDAREADPSEHRQLLNVVEEMKIAAGIPMPKVYVMETDGMNAFAAGRNPREAAIAVTTGLLSRLNREELQGVIAHEMAHVKSRDTLYNICAAVLVGAIALLADMFLRDTFFRGRTRAQGGGSRGTAAYLLLGIAFALLAPLASRLLQMSISRQREYHADAGGAEFTRNPLGLASALEKISRGGAGVPGENRGTQHLFIVNPLRAFGADSSALMSTHPPTELRIQRLRAMAGSGGAA